MLWLGEAFRIPGRVAALLTAVAGIAIFSPDKAAEPLGLLGLREAPYFWVVGIVLMIASGLTVIRLWDYLASVKQSLTEDEDLRAVLAARNSKERDILEKAKLQGGTTLELSPSLTPEIKPLVALGLLEEVEPPVLPDKSHGIYIVPMPVYGLLREEIRGPFRGVRRFFKRVTESFRRAAKRNKSRSARDPAWELFLIRQKLGEIDRFGTITNWEKWESSLVDYLKLTRPTEPGSGKGDRERDKDEE